MHKRFLTLAVIILLAVCVFGCQPTPDTPPVVNKNDGKLEEAIYEGEPPEYIYTAPGVFNYDKEFKSGEIVHTFKAQKAKVYLPKNGDFSVYRAQNKHISKDFLVKLINTCFPDATTYVHSDVMCKQDITTKYLVPYKQMLFEMENGSFDFSDYNITDEETGNRIDAKQYYTTILKNRITVTENLAARASDSVPSEPYSLTENKDGDEVNVDIPLENGKTARVRVIPNEYAVRVSYGDYELDDTNFVSNYGTADEHAYDNANPERAKECACEFAEKMCITDTFGFCELMHSTLYTDASDNFLYEAGMKPVFKAVFTRKVDGICLTGLAGGLYYAGDDGIDPDNPREYSPRFCYEAFCVFTDINGEIMGVTYKGALSVEKVQTSVKLMNFDDAINRAVEHSFRMGSNSNIKRREVTISEMRLGYMQVREKGNLGAFFLIPIWNMYINELSYYAGSDEVLDDTKCPPYSCGFQLNAIDGSRILAHKGY